jgi:outer membrane protein TolC
VAFEILQAAAAGLGVADSGYLPTLILQSNAVRSESNTSAGFSIPVLNSDSTNLSLSYVLLDCESASLFGHQSAS